jgi:hypothetical protein
MPAPHPCKPDKCQTVVDKEAKSPEITDNIFGGQRLGFIAERFNMLK